MNYFELKYMDIGKFDDELYNDIVYLSKYEKHFTDCIDTLNIKDLTEYKFGVIKEYQTISYSLNDLPVICKKLEIPFDENMRLYKAFQGFNYFVKSLQQITEVENKMLIGKRISNVSSKELEVFGYYLQIRDLAGNDITKIEAIENMKYSICFMELLARKRIGEYNEKVMEEYRTRQTRK